MLVLWVFIGQKSSRKLNIVLVSPPPSSLNKEEGRLRNFHSAVRFVDPFRKLDTRCEPVCFLGSRGKWRALHFVDNKGLLIRLGRSMDGRATSSRLLPRQSNSDLSWTYLHPSSTSQLSSIIIVNRYAISLSLLKGELNAYRSTSNFAFIFPRSPINFGIFVEIAAILKIP